MKFLKHSQGPCSPFFSVFILLVGMVFAVGSMGKYMRNKAM